MTRLVSAAIVLTIAAAGCGTGPRPTHSVNASDPVPLPSASVTPSLPSLVPSKVVAVASVTPGGFLTGNAAVSVAQHGGGAGGTRLDLGAGVDGLLADAAGGPVLTVVNYDGDTVTLAIDAAEGALRTVPLRSLGEHQSAVRIGQVLFAQEGGQVVGRRPDGSVAATYPVPADRSAKPSGDVPDEPPAAVMAALLPGAEGALLGVQASYGAVQYTDFSSGVTTALGDDDTVLAAASTPAGDIYAVTSQFGYAPQPMRLVHVSAPPFRLLSSVPLTPPAVVGHTGEEINTIRVLTTRRHGAYVFMQGAKAGKPVAALWQATDSGVREIAGVTGDLGHLASVGTGDELWIYGGPGENRVAQVDLDTGQVTRDVAWLRGPAGSRVSAVVAVG